jgi:intron-binding protein aquarius
MFNYRYPKEKIAILTTYNGQKELIRDVLNRRCAWNPFFGLPTVSTVDKFQGQQADYILLSLVRTKTIGHLRDVRRLIVALSRSRLGLYIFCRTNLFKNCLDLTPAFNLLLERPTKLGIIEDEKYEECSRKLTQKPAKGRAFTDVVAFGKHVHELNVAKMNELKDQVGKTPDQ